MYEAVQSILIKNIYITIIIFYIKAVIRLKYWNRMIVMN